MRSRRQPARAVRLRSRHNPTDDEDERASGTDERANDANTNGVGTAMHNTDGEDASLRAASAANNGGDVLQACTPAATSTDGNREATPNANRGPARGNDARAAPANALRDDGRRVSVAGATSDEVLTPWQLHDLTGAVQSAPDDFMRAYFVRYRAVHGKGIFDVDAEALRRSWCSFVYRWNQEQLRRGFVSWLEDAEDRRQRHAIGGLREIVCSIAWDTDSNCLVDVLEGCRICGGTGSRLTLDEWQDAVAHVTFDEEALRNFTRYKRAHSELSQSINRGGRGGRHERRRQPTAPRARSRSWSPTRRPTVPRDGWHHAQQRGDWRVEPARADYRGRQPDHRDGGHRTWWPQEDRRRDEHPPADWQRDRRVGRSAESWRSVPNRDEVDWSHTVPRDPEHREEAARAAPMCRHPPSTRASAHDTGAPPVSLGAVHAQDFREQRGAQLCNAPLPPHQPVAADHRDDTRFLKLVAWQADQSEQRALEAIDVSEELGRQNRVFEARLESALQSLEDQRVRLRQLEMDRYGQAQSGSQPGPRAVRRQLRRDGVRMYEAVPQHAASRDPEPRPGGTA